MKKITKWKYFTASVTVVIISIFWFLDAKESDYNKYKCETKKTEIRGVINYSEGRSSYQYVGVDNIKDTFSLNPAKLLHRKGFPEYYYFGIGDSLIKEAGSKIVTAKRGDSIVVFILDCDD